MKKFFWVIVSAIWLFSVVSANISQPRRLELIQSIAAPPIKPKPPSVTPRPPIFIRIQAPARGSIWTSTHLTPISNRPGANGQGAEQQFGPLSFDGVDAVASGTFLFGWNWLFNRWVNAGEIFEYRVPDGTEPQIDEPNRVPGFPDARNGMLFFQFVFEAQYCCNPN